jgi:hypothetical protein
VVGSSAQSVGDDGAEGAAERARVGAGEEAGDGVPV